MSGPVLFTTGWHSVQCLERSRHLVHVGEMGECWAMGWGLGGGMKAVVELCTLGVSCVLWGCHCG